MATRNASAEWRGDLKSGEGDLTVGDGVFTGAYTFSSRFEEGEGTNPEELIGAAEAACFTMQLSNELAQHGHAPESVRTVAKVHLRQSEDGATIQRIDLDTEGRVANIDEKHFAEHAEEAKRGCLISRALAGVPEMTVSARLVS
ncbi:MAG: OsmC family peroxiredoxin [Solirubrobacterales bacterium]